MKLHTWAYPWDIANMGVDNALSEMHDLGLDGLDLASNYHPITSLSPRAPSRRILNTELGAVFFRPIFGAMNASYRRSGRTHP
jgi:hypothetical protein